MPATSTRASPGAAGPSTKRPVRSRQGCSRCRYHRKKCDEAKPQCTRCAKTGTPCQYDVNLRWGGRSFAKSFGRCIDGVEKIYNADGSGGFVYRLQNRSIQPPKEPPKEQAQPERQSQTSAASEVPADLDASSMQLTPCQDVNLGSWSSLLSEEAPQIHRFLFHHYIHETIRLTAPSHYARVQICRAIVPLSLQRPSLLFAMMASAAQHLKFLGGNFDDIDALIARIKDQSISFLRFRPPALGNTTEYEAALATARTLCQAAIMFGGESWRVHLEAARAIIEAAHPDRPAITGSPGGAVAGFLSSWYNNVEALAALSPLGLLKGQLAVDRPPSRSVHFDLFGGVASDLPDLFREVGALLVECRRRQPDHAELGSCPLLSDDDIASEAEALAQTVRARLERDTVDNLGLGDGSRFSLSPRDVHDYALSNASFLHAALLYINRGVRKMPASDPEVQRSVERILWCAENMKSSPSALSPRVLMMTPLFSAGIWGPKTARPAIRAAIGAMATWTRTQNVLQATFILDKIWDQWPDSSDQDVWSYLQHQSPGYIPY